MKVGWLADAGGIIGGAERTQAEFRRAAPDGVEIVDCPPGDVKPGCDVYAIHNCVMYRFKELEAIADKPIIKYWNDVGSWYSEEVRELLDAQARVICCSPLQAEYMDFPDAELIPPPVDLARFESAAAKARNRAGTISVGSWRNVGKAPGRVLEWARGNGGVDFYGSGPFAPPDSREVAYAGMPGLLARYKRFVFLPAVIEPFGRCVAEAWASGCELIINDLVGAKYWLTENPDAIRTAGTDYWRVIYACHAHWSRRTDD